MPAWYSTEWICRRGSTATIMAMVDTVNMVAMVMVNTAMATMAITAFTLTPITATKMMTV